MEFNQRKAGVILSYIGQLTKILISILYTPIMLRLLGKSEYGLYQLVFSVVSYLSLLSLGFGSSYMRFFSRYKAKHDNEGIAQLNGMFLLVFISLSFICIFCGCVMLTNITEIFGSGLTSTEYDIAKVLMALLVLNLAITFPDSVFTCVITAHEKFLFQKAVILLRNLFNPLLALPLLMMGYGSIGMVLVTTFLTLCTFLLNVYYCFKHIGIRFSFKKLKFGLLKEMWVFTFFIFINQLIDQINWSVDKFLLGRFAGTAAVAVYGVSGQINSMYLEFSSSVSNVFIPKVNNIVAESNDNKLLTLIFTKVGRIQFIIIGLVLSGFIFFGFPFIKIWAGNEYGVSYIITLLLIIPVTIPLIQNLGIEIQRAKNMHKARALVCLVIAIANVMISIPLIKVCGPIGAAIGTAISLFAGNVLFMNWYYQSKIGLDIIYFWKQIIAFFPGLIAPCLTGIVLMKYIEITTILELIIISVFYSFIYFISMYTLGFNDYEKSLFLKIFKRFKNCYV